MGPGTLDLRDGWGLGSCGKRDGSWTLGRTAEVWDPASEEGRRGSTVHNRFSLYVFSAIVILPGIQALCAVAVFHLSLPSSSEPASPRW